MRKSMIMAASAVSLFLGACSQSYQDVPPSDIGMMLTPSGYEDKIYTPGQVDIGDLENDGRGNRLVLIQRSGIQVTEGFTGPDANSDKEDHRCLTADGAPMTLDVRLQFALSDYSKQDGREDLERIFLLGNPVGVEGTDNRVLRIKASDVYNQQARQAVRGRIRQICANYASFTAAFDDFKDQSENGMVRDIERSVATVMRETNVPLRLVNAYASNMKPDPSVITAIARQQAAERQVQAIRTVSDFISQDASGGRAMIYELQTMQEIVGRANANGHNTIIMGSGASPLMIRGR